MSASSTYTSLTVCNLGIITARCTGFTKVHGSNEYLFVVDLEWSDDRCLAIKRSFNEFQKFHQELVKLFPELKQTNHSKLNLKTSIKDNVACLFTKDKRELAESREIVLDAYLKNLLRQPERIRQCNIVLSFFESRETDPKPCKSHSPSEKSDSGIDLTNDRSPQNIQLTLQQSSADTMIEESASHIQDDENGNQQTNITMNRCSDYITSDEESENDTSETETDDETYDEDYFLDVGFGELMLQNSIEDDVNDPTTPTDAGPESSMWCSNLDKFSNILRSSMSNLHTATDVHHKSLRTLTSIEDVCDNSTLLDEFAQGESSETESQILSDDRQCSENSPYQSSDEGFGSKPLTLNNMKHYYLSTSNLNALDDH